MKVATASLLSIPLFISQLATAVSLQCDNVQLDKKKFDLSKLSGRHSVWVHDTSRPPAEYNTTWTINLCEPLEKLDGIPSRNQCPAGTRVCGVVSSWNPADDPDKKHVEIENVIPVAGNFETSTGQGLNPVITRLKSQDANADGLQIELSGGTYNKLKQKAVIQLQCDLDRTGNEQRRKRAEPSDDDDDKDKGDQDESPSTSSLQFVSYGEVEGKERTQVLRLNWRTKYACEDFTEDDGSDKKAGWGFFTWFILIAFLGISAYLIFGSWLNYNRYGARGWDLLPHGDTIRDIPYLVKDLSRKVVDTVSGGGPRGGYSAV
ncbi:hypothetical protein PV10_01149 [Exophiala mesophila]|uniref:Autophagy-related protein 27 n=1 Tax=Exophiala mesophila TaxID=212818 RepID=A0A0D2AEP9_EXOME|nr:uncharacterized protein PV10_01149 [Exophiala mesophila]KIV97393.1 hypothetical protein PV10_01149 [Exophiala mesophila]